MRLLTTTWTVFGSWTDWLSAAAVNRQTPPSSSTRPRSRSACASSSAKKGCPSAFSRISRATGSLSARARNCWQTSARVSSGARPSRRSANAPSRALKPTSSAGFSSWLIDRVATSSRISGTPRSMPSASAQDAESNQCASSRTSSVARPRVVQRNRWTSRSRVSSARPRGGTRSVHSVSGRFNRSTGLSSGANGRSRDSDCSRSSTRRSSPALPPPASSKPSRLSKRARHG